MKYNSKFVNFIFFIILCSIFLIPILHFGITDLEGYYVDFFNIKYINEKYFNPFTFFIDFVGAGSKFPIGGSSPLFHPISIFFPENIKFFFIFTVIIHFFIQVFFFKKILKSLYIKSNFYLVNFCVIFSISNLNYLWSDDWINIIYSYTYFFPIIYYAINITKKKNFSFFQLAFWISFGFINSHPGHFIIAVFFLIIFFLINYKIINTLLLNKLFYLSILLIILICSEKIYYLIDNTKDFLTIRTEKVIRNNQGGYSIEHYLFSPASYLIKSSTDYSRFPFLGIFIFFSIYMSFKILFKKISKKIHYLNLVFIFFFILTLSSHLHQLFPFISATWQFRDIVFILGLILFFYYLQNVDLKKRIILYINILLIFFSIIFYYFHYFYTNKYSFNNYFVNKNYDDKSFAEIKNLVDNERFYNKVYLSPNFIKDIRKKEIFPKFGIYSTFDLLNYNLAPFQMIINKLISNDQIQISNFFLYGELIPNYDEINNEIFLSIFNIKYLLIYQSEISKIIYPENFIKLKEIKINNAESLFFLKRINHDKKIIVSGSDINNIKCKNQNLVECINKFHFFFKTSNNYLIYKIKNNKYKIINKTNLPNNDYLVSQFLYSKKWIASSESSISNLSDRLLIIKVKDELSIFYNDTLRRYLMSASLTTLLFLVLFILFFKKKYK
jgi:hypothetical protein